MTLLDFALFLRGQSISVIPIQLKDKRPLVKWTEYQSRLASEAQIITWFQKPGNLGIVTGVLSSLVVVDFDSEEALTWAKKNLPDTPMKTRTSTSEHWYYAYPTDKNKIKTFAKFEVDGKILDLDVRADGGYVVAPYSTHETGHVYSEITPWIDIDFKTLPEFSDSWFWTAKANNSNTIKTTPLQKNILSELFHLGPAIQGSGGDDHTYRVCCHLIRDLGLSPQEALPYLLEWNKSNQPPWDTKELKEKLVHAEKYGTGSIKKTQRLLLTSAKDLLAEPPEEFNWLWSDRLTAIGTSIFVSKPKIGKTTLARGLAVSIATGAPFLGMATKKSPVVYIAAEENREQFKKALSHINPESIKDLYVHTGHAPPNLIECLEQYIEQIKPGLVILDTMIRAINVADTNSYSEMTKALAPFQELATKQKCHVMFVHHTGKVERDHGDGVLGSTAIFGSVDTLLILDKRKDQTFIKTIQRYGESFDSHILKYNKDTKEHTLGGNTYEVQCQSYEDRVMEYLGENPNSTEELIHTNTEGHKGAIGSAIRKLLTDGKIKRTGNGKRNSPFLYSPLF